MLNNNRDTILDETLKRTLSGYEASFDISGWSKMQSMLDAAPKSTTFNWKYPVYFFVVVAFLTTSYFIYNSFRSETTANKDTTVSIEPNNTPPNKAITTPVITNSGNVSKTQADTVKTNLPVNSNTTNAFSTSTTQPVVNSPGTLPNYGKVKANREMTQSPTEEFNGNRMAESQTVFGAADTVKNAITKEAEDAAKQKKMTSPVGWNSLLLNVNPDSIRKNRERMKKDTVN